MHFASPGVHLDAPGFYFLIKFPIHCTTLPALTCELLLRQVISRSADDTARCSSLRCVRCCVSTTRLRTSYTFWHVSTTTWRISSSRWSARQTPTTGSSATRSRCRPSCRCWPRTSTLFLSSWRRRNSKVLRDNVREKDVEGKMGLQMWEQKLQSHGRKFIILWVYLAHMFHIAYC